jgi:DNA-binding transcriptional ArsR family regulator
VRVDAAGVNDAAGVTHAAGVSEAGGVSDGSRADAFDAVGPVLGALADPTRRALFTRLVGTGPDTATRLSEDVPVSRQAVVKHLQVLCDAGLLSARRHGREVRYEAVPGALDGAVAWMVRSGAAWDRRLDRLRKQVARD